MARLAWVFGRLALCAALAVVLTGCGAAAVVGPTPSGKLVTPPTGNPAAGKIVFLKSTCSSCHAFAPAGTSAKIGPNLDDLAQYAQKAGEPLAEFTRNAIVKPPPAYVPPGFPTTAMPTNFGTTLTPQQLADLVAFLTQSS